jgi:peroxiredoxin
MKSFIISVLAATSFSYATANHLNRVGFTDSVVNRETSFSPKNIVADPISGKWRGEFEIKPGLKVPFNFEFGKKKDGSSAIYFLNADERFEGGSVRHQNDSVIVSLDQFDNELAFKLRGDALNGVLRRQAGGNFSIPVTAKKNITYRFAPSGGAAAGVDISGTYDIVFAGENGKEEKAVGLFKQEGKKIKGTFLRITGDSRFLEGVIEGNNFQLSSFIGSSPSYYRGSIAADGSLKGEIVGARSTTAFTGVPNENAALPDASKLTLLKEGYTSVDFTFPDANGKSVSIKDAKYKNKIVIVTITGTWCPNCIDEANFLSPWYKKNKNRGVEVIAIHYERQTDTAFVRKALNRFRQKYDVQYEQVFAGKADKQEVAASLPALNTFLSFPTLIIIDRDGKVSKIHTGFSGPATGKYYDEFVKEFNHDIDGLLAK